MKRNSILSLLFAGFFVLSLAGFAFADTEETEMSASESSRHNEQSIYAPGSWQYEGPVEAGRLPMGEDLSEAKSDGDEGFTLRESGGITFREEVDTE